jgi:hypothetical protein
VNDGENGLLTRVHTFFVTPLSSSPVDLFLIVGLLLIICFLWSKIIVTIEESS